MISVSLTPDLERRLSELAKSRGQSDAEFTCELIEKRLETFAPYSSAVADMSKEEIEHMAAGRMSSEHDHLNALLDEE